MEIELHNGKTKARVSPEGGWITSLSDEKGDIFYAKHMLMTSDGNTKARGGCHVCLPNFGPGGESSLPQHGFGRVLPWEVTSKTKQTVTLELRGGAAGYESLRSNLAVALEETALSLTLEVKNEGDMPLRIAPAFHPYFALQEGEQQVSVDQREFHLTDLAGTVFMQGDAKTLITTQRSITLTSQNLPTWAAWTDQMDAYVCVEPTVGGYTFLEQPSDNELLQPGQSQLYVCRIVFG